MCGCATHQAQAADRTAAPQAGTLSVTVEDMTCGHCAGTITRAVETGLPGTRVHADPATKIVSVQGTRDRAAVETLIAGAGYTPSAAPLG